MSASSGDALRWARYMAHREVGMEDQSVVNHYLALYHQKHGLGPIALALNGEVRGNRIIAPSPGRAASDRSMVVIVDPARPADFYIYACDGPLTAAKAMVAEKLKLILPVQQPAAERTAAAMRIWAETVPAEGTLVETYLQSRWINLAPPPVLRFHPGLWHGPSGSEWPAMVALVTTVDDRPVAIHRTYLRRDGTDKAPVDPDKMVLGPISGCAVRLSPATDELVVGEGIETCLSGTVIFDVPTWSALSVPGLKALVLPSVVRRIVILADSGDEGEEAAYRAACRWRAEGRKVSIKLPDPGFEDFNDQLTGKAGRS